MVILFFIVILIIIILQCRLTLGFTFIMNNLVCSAFVTIYFFEIALKKINIFPGSIKKKEKAKKIRKKQDLKQLKNSFLVLIKLFKKNLILKDFKLYVKEGTGDACYTAILYGFLWSITGLIPKIIFTEHKVKNKRIEIEADFKEEIWKVNFDCIFSLKIVNIIFMCKEFIKNRKGGDADVRTSDRRSNDYSHAKH